MQLPGDAQPLRHRLRSCPLFRLRGELIEQVPDIMPTWTAFTVLAGWAAIPLLIAMRFRP
ncbi:UNVERIFIED_ORG: hypothetical protein FHR35_000525 [Microbispora rosea subsp. rosea]